MTLPMQPPAETQQDDEPPHFAAVRLRPHYPPCDFPDHACSCGAAEDRLTIAAHLTALAARPSADTEKPLQRVRELADKWEAEADRADDAEPVNSDGLTRMILAARYLRMSAADLRAALDAQ